MNDTTKQTALPSHTPGPWNTGGNGNLIVFAGDGYATANATVFHGKRDDNESEANARLIAAAPCLLRACELLLNCAGLNLVEQLPGDLQAIERAKTAIAKARGQQ